MNWQQNQTFLYFWLNLEVCAFRRCVVLGCGGTVTLACEWVSQENGETCWRAQHTTSNG